MKVKPCLSAKALTALALFLPALAALQFSCSRINPLPPPDPFAITAVTSGSITSEMPIRIVFNEAQDTTSPLSPAMFRVRDARSGGYQKGSLLWEDQWTLGFVPSPPLRAASYVAFVDMAKTGPASPFSFGFTVEPLTFNVNLDPVQIDGSGQALVSGLLELSGGANDRDVEKLISAPGLGRISWTHQGRQHRFSFPPRKREIENRDVLISWSGKSIGSGDKGSATVILPGLGRFEVLEIRETGGSVIEIVFSKPLKPDQDLRGFVSLSSGDSPSPGDIRYTVEGNIVKVYNAGGIIPGSSVLSVKELSGEDGTPLHQAVQYTVPEKWDLPELRFTGSGVILPSTQGSTMAVETRNLSGLLVEAFAVYGDRMFQFLQVNRLDGQKELERVGETIWAKEFSFDWKSSDKNRWVRRGLDLSSLAEKYPGSMFYIRMSFRHRHIKYETEKEASADASLFQIVPDRFEPIIPNESRAENSYWDSYNQSPNSSESRYNDRFDPNHPAFYRKFYNHDITVGRNVLVSDLGLLAKRGSDGAWLVSANHVRTTLGMAGIPVRLINYQGRVLAEERTDSSGLAAFGPVKDVYFAYAESGLNRAYLKLNESLAIATSHFDVGGGSPVSGIRGLIYGERGVWRPGDTLYLTFLLSDPKNTLPPDHPVSFELEDPRGQIFKTAVYTKSTDGFYPIKVDTPDTAPTGDWTARIKVGGNTFTRTLKIETVMPNRLKMELDFGDRTYLDSESATATLEAAWLFGAPAPGLKADVSVTFSDRETLFPAYTDYSFRDPSRTVSGERAMIYQGSLDEAGRSAVAVKLNPGRSVPGLLNTHFLVRVFENTGAFSSQQFTMDYSPYKRYVGLKLPPGDAARNMLLTDTDHQADIVILDGDGKPVTGRTELEVAIYKLSWRWWWEKGGENRAEFTSAMSRRAISRETINAENGKAAWNFRIAYPDWGRYLVVAQDREGGHGAAKVVYIDWPGWAGRAQDSAQGAQAMLTLSPEKPGYRAGEKIALTFPSNRDAAALISVEKAGLVVSREWVKCSAERTRYEFTAEPWMMPNVYVHVTMLQPHLQTNNDLPLRLYGISSVAVDDPTTRLSPRIVTEDRWEAGSKVSFTVREVAGRPMTYTAVVVDEGLLGLTRYRQPLPHDTFYTKEASFVKTWDLYSDFMGAYSGELETLLAIGGSDDIFNDSIKDSKRFKPVVMYFEPVALKAGESRVEEFELPPYIGALRIMVLAAGNDVSRGRAGGGLRAYGTGEKSVTVSSDLMIFQTVPRVLSPGDEALIPVTVASYAEGNRQVQVAFSVRGAGSVAGGRSTRIVPGGSAFSAAPEQRIDFDRPGEKTVNFRVKAGLSGKLEITATASSPGLKDTVSLTTLEVRSTAFPLTNVSARLLNPGESWDAEIGFPGEPGTNTAKAELSRLPPLGLETRLDSLISYPHGCVEQTTSAVFPQLYLDKVMDLAPDRLADIRRNVNAGIQRLAQFQTNSGGFSYWPGDSAAHLWATNYAGHFLLEAKRAGYPIPFSLDKWVEFQQNRAKSYSGGGSGSGGLEQAYRLYTLALAGRADLGSMNRLRDQRNLEGRARWQLAAAYWYAGQRDAARTMVRDLSVELEPYRELTGTFGSELRDRAIILETLASMGEGSRIPALFASISETLSSEKWLSTQETAYALIAASLVLRDAGKAPLSVDLVFKGQRKNVSFESPVSVVDLGSAEPESAEPSGAALIRFENRSGAPVYIRASVRGTPAEGSEPETSQGLALSVEYRDMSGALINPASLRLGEDMEIRVTLKNTNPDRGVQELALVHPLPANYEIINTRLGGT
ncbi:MAG: alpha-2-macroglobulin, partial [Treponema sp.]|nr:alpha-2-macroglobulin [Treponema sp.]